MSTFYNSNLHATSTLAYDCCMPLLLHVARVILEYTTPPVLDWLRYIVGLIVLKSRFSFHAYATLVSQFYM